MQGFEGCRVPGLKGCRVERLGEWFRMSEKVRNFEDLVVFRKARALANEAYRLTRDGGFSRDFGLRDQIRRAAVSVVSNIAEGFERGSNAELIQFLYIAKGSCGEVRAQLMIAQDEGYVDGATHLRLNDECRRVSAGLANLIAYLRESKHPGAKGGGAPKRGLQEPHRKSSEFLKMLNDFVPKPFPTPPSAPQP